MAPPGTTPPPASGMTHAGDPCVPRAAAAEAATAHAHAHMAVCDAASDGASSEWQTTLATISKAVVVLKTNATKTFDTEIAGSSYATGFVVDAARGIILTNRHVVQPGPVVAEAVFLNREEIPVRALYRDPVHDFGFFVFDPSLLQFMEVTEIPLAPEAAAVGLEIRVVGNDSGEKLSILSGTIARLDREAPFYSSSGYNDENTFYIQAASGTKGGSSGSPVVDVRGRAVGLNAGSRTTSASAFYLPLQRVARALALIRAAPPRSAPVVPRGTLQCALLFSGFDELRRLGLRRDTEASARAAAGPALTGLLTVASVVPGGPADGALEAGDVITKLNGHLLTDFLRFESVLDDAIGAPITLEAERGGETRCVTLTVGDLHAITPARFLEAWGGVCHALSYQVARNYHVRPGQTYVADPGYCLGQAGVPCFSLLLSVGGKDARNLDDAAAALAALPHGARVPVQYRTFGDRHRVKTALLTVSSRWFAPLRILQRDDTTGLWNATPVPAPEPTPAAPAAPPAAPPATASTAAAAAAAADDDDSDAVSASLVQLAVGIPAVALADGVLDRSTLSPSKGVGVVVAPGLVLTDRYTVPCAAADVRLAFAAHPTDVPARVVYLHPFHNFALVEYDVGALSAAAAAAVVPATLDTTPLSRGDEVCLVGLSGRLRPVSRRSCVADATHALSISKPSWPRFRATNEEVVSLDDDLGFEFPGVLVDAAGAVRALWAAYILGASHEDEPWVFGLPTALFAPTIAALVAARAASPSRGIGAFAAAAAPRLLDAELEPVNLSDAGGLGLSAAWVDALAAADRARAQALRVVGVPLGSPARGVLRAGDFLLRVNGDTVTAFRHVEEAAAAATTAADTAAAAPCVTLTLWRGGAELAVRVALAAACPLGTRRMLHWAGVLLQAAYRGVRDLGFAPGCATEEDAAAQAAAAGSPAAVSHGNAPPPGVFLARYSSGSPAHHWGLTKLSWITDVNGVPTPDLDAFVAVVAPLRDGADVRLAIVTLDTKRSVRTLRLDLHYWPTYELVADADGEWHRRDI